MGSIFKKQYTMPLPATAEISERGGSSIARWKGRDGRKREGKVLIRESGENCVVVDSGTFYVQYRDGSGLVRTVSTKCRTREGAARILQELEKRAEHVRCGLLSSSEEVMSNHQHVPLDEHVKAYEQHLRAKGVSAKHSVERFRCLRRLVSDLGLKQLRDLERGKLEKWLVLQEDQGMGARTRNTYRQALLCFGNWLRDAGRISTNPFGSVPAPDETADPRRVRRALTAKEAAALLEAARLRPLREARIIRRGANVDKPEAEAKVRPETKRRLDLLGRERALVYEVMLTTGLRRGEVAALTVGDVEFGNQPLIRLKAKHAKNRQEAVLPLGEAVAASLQEWLRDKGQAQREETLRLGRPLPAEMSPDAALFQVPQIRVFDADLKAANIAKRDARGRTVDIHSLRHTYATWLSAAGVHPKLAQLALRHSSIDLTMNTYTDVHLLDMRAAVKALPSLEAQPEEETIPAAQNGDSYLAVNLAVTAGNASHLEAFHGTNETEDKKGLQERYSQKGLKKRSFQEKKMERDTGFEPATSSLGSWHSTN